MAKLKRYIVHHQLVTGAFIYYFGSDSLALARSIAEGLKRESRAYRLFDNGKLIEEWSCA